MRVGRRRIGNRYPNPLKGFNTTSANDVRRMALRSPITGLGLATPTANKPVNVSDDGTWPACLEATLHRGVDNGGVFGYGAAQALRRVLLKLEEKKYEHLVLSILVGGDFERDRLSYFSGHPRPAVVRTTDGLTWAPIPDPRLPGSEFRPTRLKTALSLLYERSDVVAAVFDRFAPRVLRWQWLTKEHPDAAGVDEIMLWTLRQMSELPLDKTVLLQYFDNHPDSKILAERAAIMKSARALSIPVVDTLPVLERFDATTLWRGHHTPFGNRLVCEYLFEQRFR